MPRRMASGASDDLKSSASVWGGQEAIPIDLPPAYSGTVPESSPSTTTTTPSSQQQTDPPARPRRRQSHREPYNPLASLTRWSKIPWGRYVVPDAIVSADRTTITTTNTAYLSSQQALIKLLSEQADLPPMPTLHIHGHHNYHTATANPKPDFNITISLTGLLDLTRQPRWHNRPAQVVPLPNATGRSPASSTVQGSNTIQIEQFARQFLRDKSDRKSFILSRTVENLPTDVIEGLVRNLIASLNYRGKVSVSFPVHCGQLIVQKKPAGTGAAVGGWFMNVLGLSPDVKYETLERVWAIGSPKLPSSGSNDDGDDDGTGNGNGEESGNSEDANGLVREWWNSWNPVIRDAVLLQRQGKVGVEDWIETQMGWRPKAKTGDWGVDYS